MKLNYTYVGDETPEERLRNKLQPLFFLVEKIDTDGHCDDMPELIEACKGNLDEIRDHLSDIKPFYLTAVTDKEYTQDNTSIH